MPSTTVAPTGVGASSSRGDVATGLRFFDQALEGRMDLLGRRADGMGTKGKVLSTRWVGQ